MRLKDLLRIAQLKDVYESMNRTLDSIAGMRSRTREDSFFGQVSFSLSSLRYCDYLDAQLDLNLKDYQKLLDIIENNVREQHDEVVKKLLALGVTDFEESDGDPYCLEDDVDAWSGSPILMQSELDLNHPGNEDVYSCPKDLICVSEKTKTWPALTNEEPKSEETTNKVDSYFDQMLNKIAFGKGVV